MNVPHLKLLALIGLLSGLALTPALASGKVWVGLFLAKNSPPPPSAQLAEPKLAGQLQDVFGFKFYRLLKSGDVPLSEDWDHWIIPRNDFFIRLRPEHPAPGQPKAVAYEIYQDGFIIARGTFEPCAGVPLFINGPDYHHGILIFVVDAR